MSTQITDEDQTARRAPPLGTPRRSRNRMIAVAVAGGALLLAAVAALVMVLINDSTAHVKVVKTAAVTNGYPEASSTLTPVVEADRTLSNALVELDGSKRTIRASRTATTQAQQVLTAARGALGVLTVPPTYTQLSQQATQALTQENGYLQAVSTTLDDPTGNTVASLQPLASATSSAFVPLGSVAPGGNVSIFGVDNLLKWTQGPTPKGTSRSEADHHCDRSHHHQHRSPFARARRSDPAPASPSLTFCDQNIQADPQTTTCPLAENTFVAYYNSGSTSSGWGDAVVSAYSSKTGQTYDMSCTTDQATVSCTGMAGSSPLFVTFPMQAVEIYYSRRTSERLSTNASLGAVGDGDADGDRRHVENANRWREPNGRELPPSTFDNAADRIDRELGERAGLDATQLQTLAAVQELETGHQAAAEQPGRAAGPHWSSTAPSAATSCGPGSPASGCPKARSTHAPSPTSPRATSPPRPSLRPRTLPPDQGPGRAAAPSATGANSTSRARRDLTIAFVGGCRNFGVVCRVKPGSCNIRACVTSSSPLRRR